MPPTLVQHVSAGRDQTSLAVASLKVFLPNPSLSGNALILGVECDAAFDTIGTIADDKSNTWVAGPTISTGGQTVAVFYILNATAGTSVITIPFSHVGGAIDSISAVCSEFSGVQTSGAIGPTGSVSSATPVNITLSGSPTSGDLVWMWGADIATLDPSLTSITKGTNFTLLTANRECGKVAQYSISTTSTTAGLTVSGSDTFNAVALTLHAASAGTNHTGIHIDCMQGELYGATTHTAQFPCTGNLLVGSWTSPDVTITGISDSNGNSGWTTGTSANNGASAFYSQIFYCPNATTSGDMTISLTYSGASSGENFVHFYGISGAAASPHDVDDTRNGNQASNGNLTSGVITPTTLNGLVLNVTTIDFHTITGTAIDGNGHTPTLNQQVNTGDDNASSGGTSPSHLDEDDGRASLYNSDLTQISFIYTNTAGTNPPTGVTFWSSTTSAFKAAPIGGGSPQATTTTPYIGLWSKDGVLYTGTFDAGIPIEFGLFDDGYVAQFSGTTVGATATGVSSVPPGVFSRHAQVSPLGLYGAN
jgi:hypothetical protein